MNSLAVVTLSKFDDIAYKFFMAEGQPIRAHRRIVVSDGLDRAVVPLSWDILEGEKPFNLARNTNLAFDAVKDYDVLLMNDDVDFDDRQLAMKLQELAYAHPEVGILSPKVQGEIGSGEVMNAIPGPGREVVHTQNYIPFVCVFMRREIIEKVGPLDPGFCGYGGEDTDYNMRVVAAGFKTAVAPDLLVRHPKAHSSFLRTHPMMGPEIEKASNYMRSKYHVS